MWILDMNEIDEYIKAKGITLTSSQSSQVLHLLNIYRITDFDSVCERAKKVFTGKTIKKHDGKRYRSLIECKVCGRVCCSDKKAFTEHIRSHFNKLPSSLERVRNLSGYSL